MINIDPKFWVVNSKLDLRKLRWVSACGRYMLRVTRTEYRLRQHYSPIYERSVLCPHCESGWTSRSQKLNNKLNQLLRPRLAAQGLPVEHLDLSEAEQEKHYPLGWVFPCKQVIVLPLLHSLKESILRGNPIPGLIYQTELEFNSETGQGEISPSELVFEPNPEHIAALPTEVAATNEVFSKVTIRARSAAECNTKVNQVYLTYQELFKRRQLLLSLDLEDLVLVPSHELQRVGISI